jgi:hypothetical protein
MAAFGRNTEKTFLKLHKARNMIQTACTMLATDLADVDRGTPEEKLVLQLRADIWDHENEYVKEPRRVTKLLEDFRSEIEAVCLPMVEHKHKRRDS